MDTLTRTLASDRASCNAYILSFSMCPCLCVCVRLCAWSNFDESSVHRRRRRRKKREREGERKRKIQFNVYCSSSRWNRCYSCASRWKCEPRHNNSNTRNSIESNTCQSISHRDVAQEYDRVCLRLFFSFLSIPLVKMSICWPSWNCHESLIRERLPMGKYFCSTDFNMQTSHGLFVLFVIVVPMQARMNMVTHRRMISSHWVMIFNIIQSTAMTQWAYRCRRQATLMIKV